MHRRALITAAIALLWERAVPVIWPGLTLLGIYTVLALIGTWEAVGDPWRAIAALTALIIAIALTRPGVASFSWPSREDIARRVEEDSGITARPHEALEDHPTDDDPVALAVWEAHRARMRERLRSAFARRPKAAWLAADHWGVRGTLIMCLTIAWFLAGPNARLRLDDAFSLNPMSADRGVVSLDAWIDPPAYTGRAPVFLDDGERSVSAPANSTFVARIAGARREPRLLRQSGGERVRAEVTEIGSGVYEARIDMPESADIMLRSGGTRMNWSVQVQPDTPPTIRLIDVPEATANGELDIQFTSEDDFGITAFAVEFRPEEDESAPWSSLELIPSGIATTDVEGAQRALVETAKHRLAGSRVTLRLVAVDAAGQSGYSPELGLTLPERVFLDALARAVAEQRRHVIAAEAPYAPLEERAPLYQDDIPPGPPLLAEEPQRRIERAPQALQQVAVALDAITDAPEYYFDDPIVYLGLRDSLHTLRRARDQDDLTDLAPNLWEIALRAELGSLADAEAALRAAERALAEALARGADETELAALFEAFQQAMDNYMAALAREAAEEGRFAEGGGGDGDMSTDGLQALLDALREAAELGDTAEARQALAALSELLRNMQMQLTQGGGGEGEPDEISQAIAEALEELGDVIGEQRDLQDQTFNLNEEQQSGGQPQAGQPQGGQPQSGQPQGGQPQGLAENQQGGASRSAQLAELQAQLADALQRSLQALPDGADDSAGEAIGAMREAEDALREGDAGAALDAQEEALAELRAGAEELARELLERMQEQQGENGLAEGQDEDPLGRPTDGTFADGAGVEIPDELSRARAREILEELRRRAAEAGRPQDELDYIERLLDRF